MFGLKAFPLQLEALQQANPALLRQVMRQVVHSRTGSRVVYLRRRDRTVHAISYARALLSGVWRKEQEHAAMAEPDYSSVAVERASRLIDEQESAWDTMFAELKLTALTLWYEDVAADPGRAAAEVAAYLGVTLDAGAEVAIPLVERQSQDGARAWAAKHQGA